MMNATDDPVPEPEAWAMRLRAFLRDCIASEPGEEAERVREGAALLRLYGSTCTDEDRAHAGLVNAMLAHGAAESAVLRIIGADAAFMLSRGQGDTCLATIVVPCESGEVEEILVEAATLALALLAAHIAGVIARIEGGGPALPLSRPVPVRH